MAQEYPRTHRRVVNPKVESAGLNPAAMNSGVSWNDLGPLEISAFPFEKTGGLDAPVRMTV